MALAALASGFILIGPFSSAACAILQDPTGWLAASPAQFGLDKSAFSQGTVVETLWVISVVSKVCVQTVSSSGRCRLLGSFMAEWHLPFHLVESRVLHWRLLRLRGDS